MYVAQITYVDIHEYLESICILKFSIKFCLCGRNVVNLLVQMKGTKVQSRHTEEVGNVRSATKNIFTKIVWLLVY